MPLTAIDFVPKGPVKSADLNQFFNLFTGVMLDQPVTFKNVLTLGGNQGVSTVPLKLYGAIGQTGHLLDLYADTSQAQPGFGFGAAGAFGWGPGGASPQDTFLSRVGTQNGHASDTAGILISPYLEVAGPIQGTSFQFSNGTALSSTSPLQLTINQDLLVNRNIQTGSGNITANGGYVVINGPGTGSFLYLNNSLKEYIRNPQNNGANISVESSDGYAMLTGLVGTAMAYNAYYDGVSWLRYNPATTCVMYSVDGAVFRWNTAGSGSGAVTWTTQVSMDGAGNIGTNGSITLGVASKSVAFIDSNSTIHVDSSRVMYFDTFNSGWEFRDSANGNGVRAVVWNTYEGRLGVGAFSGAPMAQLHVRGTGNQPASGWANRQNISATQINTPNGYAFIDDTYGSGGNGGALYFGTSGQFHCGIADVYTNGAGNGQGRMSFATRRNPGDTALTEAMSIDTSGAISGVSFTPFSARKLKTDIAVLEDPLSLVLDDRVHAVRYADDWSGERHVGFVADDWLPVLPEVVVLDDAGDVRALDYDRLSAVTFEALKTFALRTAARLDALERRLAA